MLPFLDPKKVAGAISMRIGKRDLKAAPEVQPKGQEMDPGLHSAAEDILRAIEAKSVIDLGHAIKAAFMVCESMPHEENDE